MGKKKQAPLRFDKQAKKFAKAWMRLLNKFGGKQ